MKITIIGAGVEGLIIVTALKTINLEVKICELNKNALEAKGLALAENATEAY